GRARVARQREGLASAAAEVDRAAVAAPAGLGHPRLSAEREETLRGGPDVAEGPVADALEAKVRDARGRVARQDEPVRRQVDEPASPPIHARLRPRAEVVRLHEEDVHRAGETLFVA